MEIRPLSMDLQAKAIEELNEEPDRINEVFQHIKEWLDKQPHLNVTRDPQILVAFFRVCKWNLQRIKERIDYFYTLKSLIPEFFENKDPLALDVQKVLRSRMIFFLPKVKSEALNPRICMLLLNRADAEDTPLLALSKVFFMMLDILMKEDDDFVISGISVITDYSGVPANFLLQFTPTNVKNYTKSFQNAYPVRIKNYWCLNAPVVLDKVYNNFCKPFLSTKLQQRVNIVSFKNSKKIFDEYSEFLPEEYGGSNGTINQLSDEWKNKIENHRNWFLEDKKYVSNEKLRQGKSKLLVEQFGVEGSFRNLVLD